MADGTLSPDDARGFAHRNVVLRALGPSESVEVATSSMSLGVGDRLLLCTDGLSSYVDHAAMERVLDAEVDPGAASRALLQVALARGGEDNVTVVVAFIDADG